MNRKKEIIKCINDLSGKYSGYEIFTDDLDGDFVTLYRANEFFEWRAK